VDELGSAIACEGRGKQGASAGEGARNISSQQAGGTGSGRVQARPQHRVAADDAASKVDVRALHTIIDDVHAHARAR